MEYPLSQLRKYHKLSDAFIRDLAKRMRKITPSKGNTLLLSGDICRDLYLIEEGMLACFEMEGRKKYCSWIMLKGDFVTAVESFNNQVVSEETIVALTACVLWVITKEDLEELTRKYPEFQIIRQILTDKYHLQSRIMDAKRRRLPEEFYKFLHKTYPAMVKEAPVAILASLMGITRSTLYKILENYPPNK